MNDTASALLSVLRDGAPGVLSLVLYLGSYLSLQLGLISRGWLAVPDPQLGGIPEPNSQPDGAVQPLLHDGGGCLGSNKSYRPHPALHHLQVFSLHRRGAGSRQAPWARTRKGPCPRHHEPYTTVSLALAASEVAPAGVANLGCRHWSNPRPDRVFLTGPLNEPNALVCRLRLPPRIPTGTRCALAMRVVKAVAHFLLPQLALTR